MVSEKQINTTYGVKPSSFLEVVADTLIHHHGQNHLSVLVVMPNSRGTVYLQEALRVKSEGKAMLLPTMLGMDDFIQNLIPEKIISPSEANLLLYKSFRMFKNPEEHLSSFLPLGQMLLEDFEVIIRAERKVEDVFGELKRWTATGAGFADFLDEEQKEYLSRFSSLFQGQLSENRMRFIELWSRLPAVFHDFQKKLAESGLATSALAYQSAVRNPSASSYLQRFDSVFFVGFGNLTQSEKSLMLKINGMKKVSFCWDIQPWYSEIIPHEVNRLFSRLKRSELFKDSIAEWENKSAEKGNPVVTQITCKGLAGMAQWINGETETGKGDVALIATDPGLVHALVSSYAGSGFPYNISMGFPLAYTPQLAWLQRILKWVTRPVTEQTQDIFWVLEDPNFNVFFPEAFKSWELKRSASHAFSEKELKTILSKGPDWLWPSSPIDWLVKMSAWVSSRIAEIHFSGQEKLAWENIVSVFNDLLALEKLSDQQEFTFQTINQLFPSILHRYSLDIQGSVSEGIQVMGLYESRLLNFRRIIIAPSEEGSIPSANKKQSFLPENIRKAFGIPTRLQQSEDEMYQFYRLTHRAEEIVFLLGNDAGKKRSRILEQIEYGGYFPFSKATQEFGFRILLPQPIEIAKNEALLQSISRLYSSEPEQDAEASLSPSSMHSLMVCPLRFYYQKIARLKEPDSFSSLEMSPMDFGNWIHNSIQWLLEKQASDGRNITKETYEVMRMAWSAASLSVWDGMKDKTSVGPLPSFEVEMEIGGIMANRFFDFMIGYEPHRWLANEWSFPQKKLEENGRYWAFSGRADIILETQTSFLILDLKTGGFKEKKEYLVKMDKTGNLSESNILKKKDYFQMLLYNRMAQENPFFKGKKVRSALFYLANPREGLLDPFEKISGPEMEQEIFDRLDDLLAVHLNQLADPLVPIKQTEDLKQCEYCSFAAICQR